MRAIRFHYRPARYLLTRWTARRRPSLAYGPLGCVSLDDVASPELPGAGWVRVETTLSGVCGSDLSALTAHDSFTLEPFGAYPFTFGHENVGRIVAAGGGVTDWSVGDRVVVNPMLSCLQRGIEPACAACDRGEYGLCRKTNDGAVGAGPMIGYNPGAGGGWARSFVAHASQLNRPGELDDEVAVLTDPFASALRPVLLHAPVEDDTVLVIGAGTIGLLTVRALRMTGWTGVIAVVGRYAFQRQMAEAAGADTVLADGDALYEWAEQRPGARAYDPTLAPRFVEGGPSLVFDTVGSETTATDALAVTREGGRVVMVGAAARISADWTRVWYRQLTIAGVFAYGFVPWQGDRRDIYDVSLELMRQDGLAALGLLTHIFDLEDYRAALAAALDKSGHRSVKVAFRPGA